MSTDLVKEGFEKSIISYLEKPPIISHYVKANGWPFILSWCHRIAGIVLVVFVWYHIYSLSSLYTPSAYDAKMKIFSFFIFVLLEWALAIPVIFHALNGGRLILYECFSCRKDETMIRWMLGASLLYIIVLGLLMLMGTQSVTAIFFWLIMLVASLMVGYGAASRIWSLDHSFFWKFQRISGSFLLVMVPAHLLFMHLNPSVSKEASVVIMRMQSYFIKLVDLGLVVGVLYHSGYGLLSVAMDYISSPVFRKGLGALIVLVMIIFALVGIRLTLFI